MNTSQEMYFIASKGAVNYHQSSMSLSISCLQKMPLTILLLVATIQVVQAQTTLYVTPSSSILCGKGRRPCLTLRQYAEYASQYFTNDTELIFLRGVHLLNRNLIVGNLSTFTMQGMKCNGNETSMTSCTRIVCIPGSTLLFRYMTVKVSINNLMFRQCGNKTLEVDMAVVVSYFVHSFILENSTFVLSTTTAIQTFHSTLHSNSNVFHSNAGVVAGAIDIYKSSVTIENNVFVNNKGSISGVIAISKGNIYFNKSNHFYYNNGRFGGAIYSAESSTSSIGMNYFVGNNALLFGGAVLLTFSELTFSGGSYFVNNSAGESGDVAAMNVHHSNVRLLGNVTFYNNGPALFNSALRFYGSVGRMNGNILFINNHGAETPAFDVIAWSNVYVSGNISFENNSANSISGAVNVFNRSTLIFEGKINFTNNKAEVIGQGIVYAGLSTVTFLGETVFSHNVGGIGGALHAVRSTIEFKLPGLCTFIHNAAFSQGGAIYLFESNITFSGNANFVNNSVTAGGFGGAISASSSNVRVGPNATATFIRNQAGRGGGFYCEYSTQISLSSPSTVVFEGNRAEMGGGVYVNDKTNVLFCSGINRFVIAASAFLGRCFFRVETSTVGVQMIFGNNHAYDGTGGFLNECSPKKDTDIITKERGFSLLQSVGMTPGGQQLNSSTISSDPFRLCFCPNSTTYDCEYTYPPFSVVRGGNIQLWVVALDQFNHTITAVVQSYFLHNNRFSGGFGQGQSAQEVGRSCSKLNYTVLISGSVDSAQFHLRNEGPCADNTNFQRVVRVNLLPCPIAFEHSHSQCICDKQLQAFTNSCNIESQTYTRTSNFWLGTYQSSDMADLGLIIYPHCPLDYCKSETSEIDVNGLDSQCTFNRKGTLCGSCRENLSLSLGSSRCMNCSNFYLALLIPFAIAGILLVLILFLLRLTVSVGTLSGLIFYANIVAVNKAIFFPAGDTNVLTVFIAWLNLDLGIETCFYSGMDAYGRTWLQYVFPIYAWILVFIIIVSSHYSVRVPRLLGRNPTSVLATLLLLSYTKILRTIITALSAVFLVYPDNTTHTVWLHDGNVGYSQGKHIPLLFISLVFLAHLFLPYTLFLYLGQWLQILSNRRILFWMNNLKVKIFLDAHYAPYQTKHRYWPGLLLLLRCFLFLVFASNTSGEPSRNLLAITSVCLGLGVLTRLMGQIYSKLSLDVLEGSFILNLGVLAAATHHVIQAGGNQTAVAYTSVSVALAEFLGIVAYHIYLQLKRHRDFVMKVYGLIVCKEPKAVESAEVQGDVADYETEMEQVAPTVSYIDWRESLLHGAS